MVTISAVTEKSALKIVLRNRQAKFAFAAISTATEFLFSFCASLTAAAGRMG